MITNATTYQTYRRGFTLIELLMVVAVIGVLTTLSITVMSGIDDHAKEEATKTTILKINRLLEQRVEAFERAYKGPTENGYITGTIGLLSGAGVNGRFDYFLTHPTEAPPEIKALARKAAFRFEFPQSAFDITSSGGDVNGDSIPDVVYEKLLAPFARVKLITDGNPSPSNSEIQMLADANWAIHLAHEAEVQAATGGASASGSIESLHSTESSEMLYFMLVESGSFGTASADGDQFTVAEIADTDGDSLPEFVDGWGNPLRFYRWPTRLVDPDAPSPFNPVFSNPNDPTEVDLTPADVSDDVGSPRRVTGFERELAEVMLKGLPPTPTPIGTSTPRDILLIDPDDPVGFLYSFLENPRYKAMGIDIAEIYNEEFFHTPDTYHSPLILSAGPDGLLGLREPNDINKDDGVFGNLAQYAGTTASASDPNSNPAVVDSLFDNVSNRNRRAGGRR